MFLKCLEVGPLASNCYIVADKKNKNAAIVDVGGDAEKIIGIITKEQLAIKYIF